jgi:release factor glutamine methyltransferase
MTDGGAGSAPRGEKVWPLAEALAWTVEYFERSGVENPRRSAEWLLSAATGLSRVELYAHHDRPLSPGERAAFRTGIERRVAGEPLQYVTGEVPFRHLVLHVRPGTFIPRPETEVLVDVALEALPPASVAGPLVVDVCTGSGAVAVSIAFERPDAVVHATEVVPATAGIARLNAEKAGVAARVSVLEGDLFSPLAAELRGRVDVVTANPPYIPTAEMADLPTEVASFEPRVALDGGVDGLDVVRRIVDEARVWLRPGGALVIETDTNRVKDTAELMHRWYEDVEVRVDLTGRDRIAYGHRREM